MIYRVLKRRINQGKLEGMEDRLNVFFEVGQLTEQEYRDLMQQLQQAQGKEV